MQLKLPIPWYGFDVGSTHVVDIIVIDQLCNLICIDLIIRLTTTIDERMLECLFNSASKKEGIGVE